MHFIYFCKQCHNCEGEIKLTNWNETMLGFDLLTAAEKEEMLIMDLQKGQGIVKVICEACFQKELAQPFLFRETSSIGLH